MMAPTLTTQRLTLRAPERGDFDAFANMMASPRTQHMDGPYDRAGAWAIFTGIIAQWQLSGFGGWIITLRDTAAFAGDVTIWEPDHYPAPEIGWTLTADAEGHGYAAEAARAALDWYWTAHPTGHLVSHIGLQNTRSAALATRLGATIDPDAPFAAGDSAADTAIWRHRRPA